MIFKEISEMVQKGKAVKVEELVQKALDEGKDARQILDEGLLTGMNTIGEKFTKNEVFVPEVLIAARAMNKGMETLEPILVSQDNKPLGTVIIGTVKGDLHDIGKNLVAMMIRSAGLNVIDLGVDVAPGRFISAAKEYGANIICMSALLTTTMVQMKEVVDQLEKDGLRDKYIVFVGGAPVTEEFAKSIGADWYTPDASTAAKKVKEVMATV